LKNEAESYREFVFVKRERESGKERRKNEAEREREREAVIEREESARQINKESDRLRKGKENEK
jgi:hypothetical protein